MQAPVENLYQVLEQAASTSGEIIFYLSGNFPTTYIARSYGQLFQDAKVKANLISKISNIKPDSILLIHFDNHFDNIQWFWATIICGNIPVVSVPFVSNTDQRRKHLLHLQQLLNQPIILTTEALIPEFLFINDLYIVSVEKLMASANNRIQSTHPIIHMEHSGFLKKSYDTAILMLTSGSSGNAKAVVLRHGQMIESVLGKSKFHCTGRKNNFLNWIGFDHVACLTEIHLHAMILGANQVHLSASDILTDPLLFLQALQKHRIAFTFAPNFFLDRLRRAIDSAKLNEASYNLSDLQMIVSGGEANVIETVIYLTSQLKKMNVQNEIIRPGFGMTETCAGSIYNNNCPSYDFQHNLEFASLGQCIPGVRMRIVTDKGEICPEMEIGNLEVCGPIVFTGYYNNPTVTSDSFSSDNWFITGDRAFLDSNGYLHLCGRAKDTIIINGLKHFPHEIETAIDEADIPGLISSYTVVFSHRYKGSETERFCVVYLPSYTDDDIEALVQTTNAILKVCSMVCGTRPFQVIPLTQDHLSKSSLGKISRAKIRASFEEGVYNHILTEINKSVKKYRESRFEPTTSDLERLILEIFVNMFELERDEVGATVTLLDLGISSVDLITFKRRLEQKLDIGKELSMDTILTNSSIRGIAQALEKVTERQFYNPVVFLQKVGKKLPLWLVHPGMGEVLVFLSLAKHITDRPVYALRARGLDAGQVYFENVEEAVKIYYYHIKQIQPIGPYIIAGYSLGVRFAYEIGKTLEANGDSVAFMGCFDFPPNIESQYYDRADVLVNIFFFMGFIEEEHANRILPQIQKLTKDEALEYMMSIASLDRIVELSMTIDTMRALVSISYNLFSIVQSNAVSGSVMNMDVFYANPLQAVARNREEWFEGWISKWSEFVRSEVRYHEVPGSHHTMLDSEHIVAFQKILKKALNDRNI